LPDLTNAIREDPSDLVRSFGVAFVSRAYGDAAVGFYESMLMDPEDRVRGGAAFALKEAAAKRSVPALLDALKAYRKRDEAIDHMSQAGLAVSNIMWALESLTAKKTPDDLIGYPAQIDWWLAGDGLDKPPEK